MNPPTIDEVLTELAGLGYSYVTIDCHGMPYPLLPDWKASAVPSVAGWQPSGVGDTPTAAFRACLDAVRAVRAASEVAS